MMHRPITVLIGIVVVVLSRIAHAADLGEASATTGEAPLPPSLRPPPPIVTHPQQTFRAPVPRKKYTYKSEETRDRAWKNLGLGSEANKEAAMRSMTMQWRQTATNADHVSTDLSIVTTVPPSPPPPRQRRYNMSEKARQSRKMTGIRNHLTAAAKRAARPPKTTRRYTMSPLALEARKQIGKRKSEKLKARYGGSSSGGGGEGTSNVVNPTPGAQSPKPNEIDFWSLEQQQQQRGGGLHKRANEEQSSGSPSPTERAGSSSRPSRQRHSSLSRIINSKIIMPRNVWIQQTASSQRRHSRRQRQQTEREGTSNANVGQGPSDAHAKSPPRLIDFWAQEHQHHDEGHGEPTNRPHSPPKTIDFWALERQHNRGAGMHKRATGENNKNDDPVPSPPPPPPKRTYIFYSAETKANRRRKGFKRTYKSVESRERAKQNLSLGPHAKAIKARERRLGQLGGGSANVGSSSVDKNIATDAVAAQSHVLADTHPAENETVKSPKLIDFWAAERDDRPPHHKRAIEEEHGHADHVAGPSHADTQSTATITVKPRKKYTYRSAETRDRAGQNLPSVARSRGNGDGAVVLAMPAAAAFPRPRRRRGPKSEEGRQKALDNLRKARAAQRGRPMQYKTAASRERAMRNLAMGPEANRKAGEERRSKAWMEEAFGSGRNIGHSDSAQQQPAQASQSPPPPPSSPQFIDFFAREREQSNAAPSLHKRADKGEQSHAEHLAGSTHVVSQDSPNVAHTRGDSGAETVRVTPAAVEMPRERRKRGPKTEEGKQKALDNLSKGRAEQKGKPMRYKSAESRARAMANLKPYPKGESSQRDPNSPRAYRFRSAESRDRAVRNLTKGPQASQKARATRRSKKDSEKVGGCGSNVGHHDAVQPPAQSPRPPSPQFIDFFARERDQSNPGPSPHKRAIDGNEQGPDLTTTTSSVDQRRKRRRRSRKEVSQPLPKGPSSEEARRKSLQNLAKGRRGGPKNYKSEETRARAMANLRKAPKRGRDKMPRKQYSMTEKALQQRREAALHNSDRGRVPAGNDAPPPQHVAEPVHEHSDASTGHKGDHTEDHSAHVQPHTTLSDDEDLAQRYFGHDDSPQRLF